MAGQQLPPTLVELSKASGNTAKLPQIFAAASCSFCGRDNTAVVLQDTPEGTLDSKADSRAP